MFNSSTYESMYKRFMGPLARDITVLVRFGSGFIGYPMTAHVTRYKESDMIPGSSIQMGDLRVIILAEDMEAVGIESLELKDRLNIDGRAYSIVNYDAYTRTLGGSNIAAELAVRGGGSAIVASIAVYRIIGNGDRRITGDGDFRIIREAV